MHHPSASCSCTDGNRTPQKIRLLTIALLLTVAFAVTELGVGLFSHSLALLADSGHLMSDCLAIILALLATWIARRSTSEENSTVETIAALINGIGLVIIALWIAWEAVERLQSPAATEILSLPMLITAIVGFGVNSINIMLLHKESANDLNLKGAFLHIVADAASSVGVAIAAIAVWALDWIWADSAISLFVSGLIILTAIPLIFQSTQQLFRSKKGLEERKAKNSPSLLS